MVVDLKELRLKLAENKVYDAWQYVESLYETLTFMDASHALLEKIYELRKDTLQATSRELFREAIEHSGEPVGVTEDHLRRTNLNIAGLEIDDSLYLRKTALEFFHYARISIDVLLQIINAALFGNNGFPVNDKNLPVKVTKKLGETQCFCTLRNILKNGFDNGEIEYLYSFDNFIKHVKTILISIKNSFLLGNKNEFTIGEFTYKGNQYPQEDALSKITTVRDRVYQVVNDSLIELMQQIPNCLGNDNRYHTLKFKQINQKGEQGITLKYMSYFIEVNNDLSELPAQIKIMPLIIKPNQEIYSFVLDIDKIFVSVKDKEGDGIIGVATLDSSTDNNELYKTYNISSCTMLEYFNYINHFTRTNKTHRYNINALQGEIIFIKDDNLNKPEYEA